MKLQIKNLKEEKSRLQEENSKLQQQVQAAQAFKYSIFSLDLAWSIIITKKTFPSGSPEDHTRLVAAAQALVNVVDEGGSSNSKSLVERLEEAPQKIFDVLTATSKNYLTHMIGVVKSYLPQFNLALIAKGIAPSCSYEKFREYCKESEVIAEEILKNMIE